LQRLEVGLIAAGIPPDHFGPEVGPHVSLFGAFPGELFGHGPSHRILCQQLLHLERWDFHFVHHGQQGTLCFQLTAGTAQLELRAHVLPPVVGQLLLDELLLEPHRLLLAGAEVFGRLPKIITRRAQLSLLLGHHLP